MSVFDEVKAKLPISSIISQKVRLHRKGRLLLGLCPFHQEKTPSFSISDEKGFYHCFGCGAHGTVIDFLMESENLSLKEALEKAASLAGISLSLSPQENASRRDLKDSLVAISCFYESILYSPRGHEGKAYLKKRGISEETAKLFSLGLGDKLPSALNSKDQRFYEVFKNRLIFPIKDMKGHVVGFGGRTLESTGHPKYINSPESDVFYKSHTLYNEHLASKEPKDLPLLIVEGYMDTIALYQGGFHKVVAIMGTALSAAHLMKAWRLSNEIIFIMDGDEAGKKAQGRLLELAFPLLKPGQTFFTLDLPKGEDPDSFMKKRGENGVKELLNSKKSSLDALWEFFYQPSSSGSPEYKALLETSLMKIIETIEDSKVRFHYIQEIRKKLFYSFKAVPKKMIPRSMAPFDLIQEYLLLWMVLNKPSLLEKEVEKVFLLINDLEVKGALESLLEAQETSEESFRNCLRENGYEQLMSRLEDPHFLIHVPRSLIAEKGIEDAWSALYQTWIEKHMRMEREAAKIRLNQNPTQENWDAYKALISSQDSDSI